MEKVSVKSNVSDIEASVWNSVELVSGYSMKPSDCVVIKPNICNAKNPNNMVLTDFRLIEAVVNQVQSHGNNVIIVESDNISGTAEKRAEGSGFLNLCDRLDVEFMNLSHDDYEEFPICDTILRMPRTVLDADYFINLPKIKTCAHTLVTLAIKNLYGVFQRKKKDRLHKHLDELLPFLARTVRTDLVVVDGLTCMEGNGPVIGNPVPLGVILAGKNLVAVDSICSRLMGYDPASIPHISLSSKQGVGPVELDNISVIGDELESLVREFEPPYTLKATIKSWKAIRDVYIS